MPDTGRENFFGGSMLKKLSILLVLLLSLGLIIGAAGCGGGGEAEEPEEGAGEETALVLDVGTDAAYAPFEYKAGSGEIEGFDAELIKAIADAAGLEMEIKHVDWDGLFPALEAGDINAIISAMTITEERQEVVDFSDPYFEATQIIAVKEGSEIAGLADLSGKIVGVQMNTTGQYAVEKVEGVKEIKKYPTTPDAIMNLENGVVEAVVADSPVVLNYVQTNPDCGLTSVTDDFEKEYYGIAVKKGNEELLTKINEGLATVKEDGTYDEIYAKYFGE